MRYIRSEATLPQVRESLTTYSQPLQAVTVVIRFSKVGRVRVDIDFHHWSSHCCVPLDVKPASTQLSVTLERDGQIDGSGAMQRNSG